MLFAALDQVLRHRVAQRRPADEQRDRPRELGRVECGLARGIGAADDEHVPVAVEEHVARRRSVVDARAHELVDARRFERAVLGAHRPDHGPSLDDCSVGELERDRAVGLGPPVDHLGADHDLRAEPDSLVVRQSGELAAGDPLRETGVVLDPRARARLAARGVALDHERPQPFRRGVHGCRQPRRPGADDHDVVALVVRRRVQPDPGRELDPGAQECRGQDRVRRRAGDGCRPRTGRREAAARRSTGAASRCRTSGFRSTSIHRNETRLRSRKSRYSWTCGEPRRPIRYVSPPTTGADRAAVGAVDAMVLGISRACRGVGLRSVQPPGVTKYG